MKDKLEKAQQLVDELAEAIGEAMAESDKIESKAEAALLKEKLIGELGKASEIDVALRRLCSLYS